MCLNRGDPKRCNLTVAIGSHIRFRCQCCDTSLTIDPYDITSVAICEQTGRPACGVHRYSRLVAKLLGRQFSWRSRKHERKFSTSRLVGAS